MRARVGVVEQGAADVVAASGLVVVVGYRFEVLGAVDPRVEERRDVPGREGGAAGDGQALVDGSLGEEVLELGGESCGVLGELGNVVFRSEAAVEVEVRFIAQLDRLEAGCGDGFESGFGEGHALIDCCELEGYLEDPFRGRECFEALEPGGAERDVRGNVALFLSGREDYSFLL